MSSAVETWYTKGYFTSGPTCKPYAIFLMFIIFYEKMQDIFYGKNGLALAKSTVCNLLVTNSWETMNITRPSGLQYWDF